MALKIESMRFKNHLVLFLACLFIQIFYAPRIASAKLLQVKSDGSGDFQTVQSCVDQAIPGDTCLVSSGNFPERVSTKRNGTSSSPIIIKSQGNTIMQGFEIIHNYITVDGFEVFHNLNANCNVDTSGVGGINIRGSYATVINNYIHDMKGFAGIYSLYIATGVIVRNNRIFHSQYGIRISGDSWLVENNEIDHPYPHCSNTDADYVRFFGTGHVIRGNYLHGATYAETPLEAAHLDCFQTFDNNAVNVTKNILIENNMCLDAHDGIITEGHYNKKTSDITVRNNVFARMLLPSMNFTLNFNDTPNVIVEGNTIALGNGGAVASLYQNVSPPMSLVIKNNILTGFGPYRSIAYSDGDTSLIEDYNLITSKTGTSNTATPGAHDLLAVSPSFVNINDIEGPDKIPFTADDGLRLLSSSTVCGKGENGKDMGAYPCGNIVTVPLYKLTVVNGTGSGSYAEGNSISISASNILNSQVFDRWVGAHVANDASPTTTILIPQSDTTVTATYKDVSTSGNVDESSRQQQSEFGFLSINSVVSAEHPLVGQFNLSSNSNVKISIVDRSGTPIRELSHSDMNAGSNPINWDGKNSQGVSVSSGIFLLKLEVNGNVYLKKIVVVK